MKQTSAVACAAVLAGLSALHVAWAAGATPFKAGAVPTRPAHGDARERAVMDPGPLQTLIVAVALAVAAVAVLRAGIDGKSRTPAALVSLAFGARAIGDFRYVGMFKRVRGTTFARNDSQTFVPICCAVSVLAGRAAA